MPTSIEIEVSNITIHRDKWGVPHIFSKTDEEAAYGLAIASCEDGFETLQMLLAFGNGVYGEFLGLKGVEYDYITQLLEIKEITKRVYDYKISEKFNTYLEAYALGINKYAAKHPNKVVVDSLFPITPKKIIHSAHIAVLGFARVGDALNRMAKGKFSKVNRNLSGSNAFAFGKKTVDTDETVLVLNPHQPINGFTRNYEFHLCSQEGLNMYGTGLMGIPIALMGTNENLGWAMTRNYTDLYDVYKLEMHPKKRNTYLFDGEWEKFEVKKAKLTFKLFNTLKVTVYKKCFKSIHGPVLKGKEGWFALKMPGFEAIDSIQQWYYMAKSKNFDEFNSALNHQAFPSGNIIYADKWDNIYYIYNGLFPEKKDNNNYIDDLPGNTSQTLWEGKFMPLTDLPHLKNPASGYLFNCNHTPFDCSGKEDDLSPANYKKDIGIQLSKNSRSIRVRELLDDLFASKQKLSIEDICNIKYDVTPPHNFYYEYLNVSGFKNLNPSKYPSLAEEIKQINTPNISASKEDINIALLILANHFIQPSLKIEENIDYQNKLTDDVYAHYLKKAKMFLLKHHGTTKIALSKIQFLKRGDIKIPVEGMKGTIHDCGITVKKDGTLEVIDGEALFMLVQFKNERVAIHSILPYGNSDNPNSPNYTDQMELFANKQTKHAYFYKEDILKNSISHYHPIY